MRAIEKRGAAAFTISWHTIALRVGGQNVARRVQRYCSLTKRMAKRHTLRLAVLNSSPPLIFAFPKKQPPVYRIDESAWHWEMGPVPTPKPLPVYFVAWVLRQDGSDHSEQDCMLVW